MKKNEIVLINHQGLKLVAGIQVQTPTPPIGLAYIGSYIKKHGYDYTAIDACGEALSQVSKIEPDSDLLIQGLTDDDLLLARKQINRIKQKKRKERRWRKARLNLVWFLYKHYYGSRCLLQHSVCY